MRKHALLSASSAHRWLYCTPSARLEATMEETSSGYAEEGTLAHELAEAKVRNYFYTVDFGKRKLTNFIKKLKEREHWDDEMLRHTDVYLDYIKSVALSLPSAPSVMLEKEVNYGAYAKEGFGTADCILIGSGILHIIDFKYGMGVPVNAEGNPQLSLYALGAYETYRLLYPIKRIKLTVVQPRISNISEWETTLDELLDWGEWVKKKAALAWEGKGEFSPNTKTCRFCRAKGQCRARSDHNVKLAFSPKELPPLIASEEAGERLLALEDVVKYQKDLQEWALSQCLSGKEVPGWKAVEGKKSRNWTDMDKAFAKLLDHEIPKAMLYEEKPLTLAQVEKMVGKKEFTSLVGEYVVKNPGKPTLVKVSDKREAITNIKSAQEAFKEEG